MKKMLTLDSRRRVSFRNVGWAEHTMYEAETMPNGMIIMRPVQIVPHPDVNDDRDSD